VSQSIESRKARIAEIESRQFNSVCTAEILKRGRDLLALHIKAALSGRDFGQYWANVEARR
jgi:hypothetical protein